MINQKQLMAAAFWAAFLMPAHARDLGQWENTDPGIREWYRSLMQPDNPTISCCGAADAYWADDFELNRETGEYVAIITDDRIIPGRPEIPVGTKFTVPISKFKTDKSNPTGHAVIFLSPSGRVYCFVTGTLI